MFAGDRRDELRRRLAGATYAEIAADGGGILSTVAATRAASEERSSRRVDGAARRDARVRNDDLREQERIRSDTAIELRILLSAIARARRAQPIDIVPTFMGAHEVPPEYPRPRATQYVA